MIDTSAEGIPDRSDVLFKNTADELLGVERTLAAYSVPIPSIRADATVDEVENVFRDDAQLLALAVVTGDGPYLLTRQRLHHLFVGRGSFGRALLSRATADELIDRDQLVLTLGMTLRQASRQLIAQDSTSENAVLVVGEEGGAHVCSVKLIMQEVGQVYREVALRDALTGLPNRLKLEQSITELTTEGGDISQVAMLYIDLDGFKKVNDLHGHAAGDEVLIEFSRRLTHSLRHGDLAARMGGDEFVVVMPGADENAAMTVANRIVDIAQLPIDIGGNTVAVSASVGVAFSRELLELDQSGVARSTSEIIDGLLQRSDGAMLRVKRSGKAHANVLGSEEVSDRLEREGLIARKLRQAIAGDELHLVFQPKIDLPDDRMRSVEALLRWHDAELGDVEPTELLNVAEHAGEVLSLGKWVLRQACRQARSWQQAGTEIAVAVNLSPTHLAVEGLVGLVLAELQEAELPPRLLSVEVTESREVLDMEVAQRQLRGLQAQGIEVHLDDFGTGYSTLGVLGDLPINVLKIDLSLIARIDNDHAYERLIAGVIESAHLMGFAVVAEGVERPSQLELLRGMGCDTVQGYLLGRPLPAAELVRTRA